MGDDSLRDRLGPYAGFRRLYRTCGQIDGRVDALYPFLFIARFGTSYSTIAKRGDDSCRGLFVLSEGVENAKSAAPRQGLILPLSCCRDENLKQALLEVSALLAAGPMDDAAGRRDAAEAVLQAHGFTLRLPPGMPLDGFAEIGRGADLFTLLHRSMDYVTAVWDEPTGTAAIAETAPLPWSRYGLFMEWVHSDYPYSWSQYQVFLVYANVVSMRRWLTTYEARDRHFTPQWRLSEVFRIRSGLQDAELGVAFTMGEYGWASLDLSMNDVHLEIDLSDVYPPFRGLIAWLKRIEAGDLPAGYEIDEEGTYKRLVALPTAERERLFFAVCEGYAETIHVQGIVDRRHLVTIFRSALFEFFTNDFDPEQWRDGSDEAAADLPQKILLDDWFDDLR